MLNDFEKFARSRGVSPLYLNDYANKGNVNYNNPTIIEERSRNITAMDVFSKLLMNNIVFVGDAVEDQMANVICSQLLWLDSQSDSDIMVYVNSPGGHVTSGLAIVDTLNFVRNKITTTCIGMAASMGAVILSSGTKGQRFAMPNSSIPIHAISGGTYGNINDMNVDIKESNRINDLVLSVLAENTGKTLDEIKKAVERDNWMAPQDAIDFGLIDGIISKK